MFRLFLATIDFSLNHNYNKPEFRPITSRRYYSLREGVITTRSNRMKFRLNYNFSNLNGYQLPWFQPLNYYMRNFCNLIGLEQWYFSLIWNTHRWKLQPFVGSSITYTSRITYNRTVRFMPKQEPIMALGQSDWTVRDHARARLNSVFSLLARKKVFEFLVFWFKKKSLIYHKFC